MGIAKNIEALAVYADYSADTAMFIQTLSNKLNADFIINTYDNEFKPIHEENLHTNFNKANRYRLTINFDDFKIEDKTVSLPTYELQIPIKYIYEETVDLIFYPNNGVHLMFLTFEHMWRYFIDVLRFKAFYQNRQQAIARYETLRNEYIFILKKLGIGNLFIITDAYYCVEDIVYEYDFRKLEFTDILVYAKEKDKLTSFNFEQILKAAAVSDLSKDFIDMPELSIALVDNLTIL